MDKTLFVREKKFNIIFYFNFAREKIWLDEFNLILGVEDE
jgi:hypothetical protein